MVRTSARPEKVAVVDEVRAAIDSAAGILLTDYRGLSVAELAALRAELRKVNASYRVVKNTLTLRAAQAAGIDGLEGLLTGPTALVVCDEDPVGPAKALRAFAKDHGALVVKGGYLDGAVLDDAEALRLADLESREDVLAGIAGLVNNALATVVNLAMAAQTETARLLAALVEDGGAEAKGFSPSAAAAAPAGDAPAADAPAEDAPAEDAEVAADGQEAPPAADAVAEVAPAPAVDDAEAADDASDSSSSDSSDSSDDGDDD